MVKCNHSNRLSRDAILPAEGVCRENGPNGCRSMTNALPAADAGRGKGPVLNTVVHPYRLPVIRFAPVAAPLLRERRLTAALTAVAILQIWVTAAGLTGWSCPVRSLSGWPCPGCGLSRALAALIDGRWHDAFSIHPFAFAVAPVLMAAAVAAVLPERHRAVFVDWMAALERRTGIFIFLFMGLVLHWIFRIA
jgi:hypothetical protein